MSKDESAAERAYRIMRDDILSGVYAMGTMLSEGSLAAEIGVSRTPIRAALVRLQDEGWITIYPKRGALVRELSRHALKEFSQAKVLLEAGAVRGVDPQAMRELAERLRPHLPRQREALLSGDTAGFVELTIEFHRSFVEVGRNAVLIELYNRLADRQRFVLFAHGERLLDRTEDILAEHTTMLDHLAAGDPEGFERALRAHLSDTYDSSL